jgi:hypothetical protein
MTFFNIEVIQIFRIIAVAFPLLSGEQSPQASLLKNHNASLCQSKCKLQATTAADYASEKHDLS